MVSMVTVVMRMDMRMVSYGNDGEKTLTSSTPTSPLPLKDVTGPPLGKPSCLERSSILKADTVGEIFH